MTHEHVSGGGRLHRRPPAPKGFDPFGATAQDLARYGMPRRPDPRTEPDLAALWERKAAQYRDFEHLAPVALGPVTSRPAPSRPATSGPEVAPGLGPDAIDSAGYSLTTTSGPFTSLFVTWTVPDLTYDSDAFGINSLHTFVGLGFLDVHVQLSVDSSQSVTCALSAEAVGAIGMSVRPGDIVSASLCLNPNPSGAAAYFFTNETTAQTMSFSVNTGFPPAVTVNAGVTRDGVIRPGQSLARFGTVYFDEISAYNSSGHQSLLAGEAITMTDSTGAVLATPYELTDYAFKVVRS
jgi:hypothetical protein